ncbi:MAG: carboxypeptidase regulatory-like domain-containing protein [Nitrospirae bacterium]|nr:MAG: carboxypeptidase regulatory-like domain-containing protein [Nitrospirota bacterium]
MRESTSVIVSFLVGSALLTLPLLAEAGGTIKGKVTFSGKVPPPKEFEFAKFPNPDFCKQNPNKSADGNIRLLKEVEVGPDKGLKNAIVSVRDIKDKNWMKKFKKEPAQKVIAKLCEFLPFTGIVVNKGKFYVENTDADPNDPKSKEGVLHNPHAFDVLGARSSTLFNIGLAKKGDSLLKPIKMRMARKGSVMRLQCDQHEFMQSWFLPVTNPYYVRVNDDGTFELKDVPAGKHKVMAWHPVAGKVEKDVEVKDGATVEVNFEIKKK